MFSFTNKCCKSILVKEGYREFTKYSYPYELTVSFGLSVSCIHSSPLSVITINFRKDCLTSVLRNWALYSVVWEKIS